MKKLQKKIILKGEISWVTSWEDCIGMISQILDQGLKCIEIWVIFMIGNLNKLQKTNFETRN